MKSLAQIISKGVPEYKRRDFFKAIAKYRMETHKLLSPADRGKIFKIPRLMSEIQGVLKFADTDVFMEYHDWSLLDHSPKLDEKRVRNPGDGAQL